MNFDGTLSGAILGGFQATLSGSLNGYIFGASEPSITTGFEFGARYMAAITHQLALRNEVGLRTTMHGGVLFDRIVVMPSIVDAGFVLSEKAWSVEVWNTHLDSASEMTSRAITGPGNLTIDGPATATFQPGQSYIFTATLPQHGDANIQIVASWVFAGEPIATMSVSGSRITVFAFRPDWTDPFSETVSYLTEVLTGYSNLEQRRALRRIPRYSVAFRVLTCSEQETSALENMVYGWQTQVFGIPWWPEMSQLTSSATPGSSIIYANTTLRPSFEVGGLAVIWKDYATWEAVQIKSVASGYVELVSPIQQTWTTKAKLIPVRRGRMGDPSPGRPANWLTAGIFSFTCEAL